MTKDGGGPEAWKERATMAKMEGWRLLYAAKKCFEAGQIADEQAILAARDRK